MDQLQPLTPTRLSDKGALRAPRPIGGGGNDKRKRSSLTDRAILIPAIAESFKKLDPRLMARNPVMFVVEIGSVITTIVFVAGLFNGAHATSGSNNELFVGQIAILLWFTVLFATFAEAVAEGRGKAQAAALRKPRSETIARRLVDGREEHVPAP